MSGGLEFPMQGVSQQLRVVVFALQVRAVRALGSG